jgi:hypothetical protein
MGEAKDRNFTKLIEINGGELDHNHDLEMIRQTLQHVASKLQHVAQKACSRLDFLLWGTNDTLDRSAKRDKMLNFGFVLFC